MVFSRIRFRVPGLYRVQHPFGQDFFDVGAAVTAVGARFTVKRAASFTVR